MSSLTESPGQVMAVDGVRAAALIDIATGMVVRSAGEECTDFPAAATSLADDARMARAALEPGRPGGDLDEISLVTEGQLHLTKILGSRLGEAMLLFVDLDRTRVNMALASLRAGQLAPAILAQAMNTAGSDDGSVGPLREALADGRRTARDLAFALRRGVYATMLQLARMHQAGQLTTAAPPVSEARGPQPGRPASELTLASWLPRRGTSSSGLSRRGGPPGADQDLRIPGRLLRPRDGQTITTARMQ